MLKVHGKSPGPQRQLPTTAMFIAGIVAGLIVGYIFMGTTHAILETRLPVPDKVATGGAGSAITKVQEANKRIANTIHTLHTSNGSPYQNYQSRIMYGTYKIVQKMPGGEFMTGFTRILHRMTPDVIMGEMDTFRADPLHPKCDDWCDFPVADRPNAVTQWIKAVEKDPTMLKGDWVFMAECDYVWMKPLQAPDASDPKAIGAHYAFDYIAPTYPTCVAIIKRLFNGGDPELVPNSGPAPALIRFDDYKKVVPDWERLTADIENDEAAKKELDWVREMYAWDVAVALQNVSLDLKMWPKSNLLSQPPHDQDIGAASMYHYTWGVIYKDGDKEIWKWDKRFYTEADQVIKMPKIPLPPPFREGLKIQDGMPVTKKLHDTLVDMLTQMNKAIDALPPLAKQ